MISTPDVESGSYQVALALNPFRQIPRSTLFQYAAALMETVALDWYRSPVTWVFPARLGLQLTVTSNFEFRVQLAEYTFLIDSIMQIMSHRNVFSPGAGTLWHNEIVAIAQFSLDIVDATQVSGEGKQDPNLGLGPLLALPGASTNSGSSGGGGGDIVVARSPSSFPSPQIPPPPPPSQLPPPTPPDYHPPDITFRYGRPFTQPEPNIMLTFLSALRKAVNANPPTFGWPSFSFDLDVVHLDIEVKPVAPFVQVERLDVVRALVAAVGKEYEYLGTLGGWRELRFVVGREGKGVAEGGLYWTGR